MRLMDFDALKKKVLGDKLPPAESRKLWLDEARRRAQQIDNGEVELIAAEEVARKAQALLR